MGMWHRRRLGIAQTLGGARAAKYHWRIMRMAASA